MAHCQELLIAEDDVPFEEEILRHPYSIKSWQRYIGHKCAKNDSFSAICQVYERALKQLPGSYKLWNSYLTLKRTSIRDRCIDDPLFEECNSAHERGLVFMHKMPRIWINYCMLMMLQRKIVRTRQVFDLALRSLPLTQHHRIWPLYLHFLSMHNIPGTADRIFKRYLKLEPESAEDYVQYLISIGKIDEAAWQLAQLVNQAHFVSKNGKSQHDLWIELCELIAKNPDKVKSLKVADIIRSGLMRFTDGLGQLWTALANYYIRSKLYGKARDVFEEALSNVMTVHDFGQIFDAYTQFEEMVTINMMKSEKVKKSQQLTSEAERQLEFCMSRLENLIDRRPILLSSVLLRQNPQNVDEWIKRVRLVSEWKPEKVIETFTEAIKTIDPKVANGKLSRLWIDFASYYECILGQLEEARLIYEKAVKVPYRAVDELSSVWCNYAEMELRHNDFELALQVLRRSTSIPSKKINVSYFDHTQPVQSRVHKSIRLWSFYADLEESIGTFERTKAVYHQMLGLKVANPQIIINFATLLEEHNCYEESFQVFEKGLSLFKWPHVSEIWHTYLCKFIDRYGPLKLERIRDLFEQLLSECPPESCFHFYLMYVQVEEEFGMAKRVMAILDRASKVVPLTQRLQLYQIYIKKTAELYGVTFTREIFSQALESLPDQHSIQIGLDFAELERNLGEIDRARSIYCYTSQLCDPRLFADFWKVWRDFEVKHGSEDTFREMLRIKRTVTARFATQFSIEAAQVAAIEVLAAKGSSGQNAESETNSQAMQILERSAEEVALAQAPVNLRQVVSSGAIHSMKAVSFVKPQSKNPDDMDEVDSTTMSSTRMSFNPDEIDLMGDEEVLSRSPKSSMVETEDGDNEVDDQNVRKGEEDEDLEKPAIFNIETKKLPKFLFGGFDKPKS